MENNGGGLSDPIFIPPHTTTASNQKGKVGTVLLIEQKGMTFNHDFGYSFTFFTSFLKKEERRINSKNRYQK